MAHIETGNGNAVQSRPLLIVFLPLGLFYLICLKMVVWRVWLWISPAGSISIGSWHCFTQIWKDNHNLEYTLSWHYWILIWISQQRAWLWRCRLPWNEISCARFSLPDGFCQASQVAFLILIVIAYGIHEVYYGTQGNGTRHLEIPLLQVSRARPVEGNACWYWEPTFPTSAIVNRHAE